MKRRIICGLLTASMMVSSISVMAGKSEPATVWTGDYLFGEKEHIVDASDCIDRTAETDGSIKIPAGGSATWGFYLPYNTEKFMPIVNKLAGSYKFAFLKNEIAEEDLPQILRFFDFMLTDVGQKLTQWGPRSAGLFEETENGRRFIAKEIEAEAVYGESNDAQIKYGLNNKQWPGYPAGPNRWQPIYIYDFVPNIARMNHFYSTGVYDPIEIVQSIVPNVYAFKSYVPETEEFWSARTAFETAMTKIMVAKNDEEFETLYQNLIDVAVSNKLTPETLEKINDAWKNDANKDYMHNVEDYLKAIK